MPFLDRVGVDGSVLAFTFAISVASGAIFGLLPAREAARVDLASVLRDGGRAQGSSRGGRLRNGLVVGEVALALVVAAAAGLMLRTFDSLQSFAPGFAADRILTLRTSLRGDEFATPRPPGALRRTEGPAGSPARHGVGERRQRRAAHAGRRRVQRRPPVDSRFPDDSASPPNAVSNTVMPDFFATLGIPVLQGRGITADDRADSRRVAVINRAMADKYFPAVNPLGRSFSLHGSPSGSMEIVGVAGDVLTAANPPTPRPVFYIPYTQGPLPVMTVVMRVPVGIPWPSPGTPRRRLGPCPGPRTPISFAPSQGT